MSRQSRDKAAHHAKSEQQTCSSNLLSPEDVVIGRDVLELVTSAMYVDPMTVYREYVQNAADSIDEARRGGLLPPNEPGLVDVDFDVSARSIRIRDNGSAIAWPSFVKRLSALGASAKRGTAARGFRGVGRLAGLSYAQELIFRSRATDEDLVSEMRWDCRKLKTALRAANGSGEVAELIRSIVTINRINADSYPNRFFEVELKGVVRLRSDKLMSPAAVAEYLGQIAPVPFSPEFRFGSEITAALRSVIELGELEIRVTGIEGPVYRPHRDAFTVDEKRSASFDSVEIVEAPGIDGDVAAVAWILHHDYEGAVPNSALIKGLRLRSGNIQVGDHTLLEELFPEPRFNSWSVGEVHVVDRRIVPNGRRDHFEQNAHLHNLLNHLAPTARAIARLCRTSSVRRKWVREFEIHHQTANEKLGIITQGSLSAAQRDVVALSVEQTLLQMEKIAGIDLLVEDTPEEMRSAVTALRSELRSAMRDDALEASPLARLIPERRAMYEHMFDLIYDCSTNRTAAKALIDRILMKVF